MRWSGPFEIVWHDEDGGVGVWRRSVVLGVRHGPMTAHMLKQISEPLLTLAQTGQAFGMLSVVEAGAPMPGDDARQAQRGLVDALTALDNVRMAPVLLGDDVPSTMSRSSARLVSAGNRHVQLFRDVPAAAAWLAEALVPLRFTVQSADLVAAAGQFRTLAREKPTR